MHKGGAKGLLLMLVLLNLQFEVTAEQERSLAGRPTLQLRLLLRRPASAFRGTDAQVSN